MSVQEKETFRCLTTHAPDVLFGYFAVFDLGLTDYLTEVATLSVLHEHVQGRNAFCRLFLNEAVVESCNIGVFEPGLDLCFLQCFHYVKLALLGTSDT